MQINNNNQSFLNTTMKKKQGSLIDNSYFYNLKDP